MNQTLGRKYSLLTAICLVVGAVIGSGIFFLNERVFDYTGGRLYLAVIAWLIGGAIMFVMMWVWGQLAKSKETMNGLMDFSDELVSRKYSYFLSWFLGTILYPSFVAVLAWVSARFIGVLLQWERVSTGGPVWMLAGVILIGMYAMNVLSPKIAGHFQISTTFIKVIPLILMGVVGIIVGIVSGTTVENFAYVSAPGCGSNPLYMAVLATIFAYAGSEEVLMMNAEIKDSKKNLPRAIVLGSVIIISIYVLYTIGVFGSTHASTLSTPGGIRLGFSNIFGPAFGNILIVFIIISCLGAMNSAMMAGTRAFYSIALRGLGPKPDTVKSVDAKTDMPATSAAISLICCGVLMFIVFANSQDLPCHPRWFGDFNIAVTSLTPITLMAFYIPMFVNVMRKETTWNPFNRYVMPLLSIGGALLLVYMVFATNHLGALIYLAGFAVVMIVGAVFLAVNRKK